MYINFVNHKTSAKFTKLFGSLSQLSVILKLIIDTEISKFVGNFRERLPKLSEI